MVLMRKQMALSAVVFAAGIAAPGWTQSAQAPALQALTTLQTGQWELKLRDGGKQTRTLCINDMRELLQLQHSGAACTRFVITNQAKLAIVNYSCPKAGHGRTSVKVETPRLVQVESQGIENNEPFSFALEGRRIGACPAQSATGAPNGYRSR